MSGKKIGLIVEGGGMRGAYTSGVLEAFSAHNIYFPYIAAVSAGANTSCSYISRQHERNNRIYTEWITDKRFVGLKNLFKEGSYFGMNFLFDELPNKLDPFDFETFKKSDITFKVGTAHCKTGRTTYFEPNKCQHISSVNQILRASSSLPVISKTVQIDGEDYLDGGITNPIPLSQSIVDGNTHHVVILTRNEDYRKKFSKTLYRFSKYYLKHYPKIIEKIKIRHEIYNETLDKINTLHQEGRLYIFRPKAPLKVDRFEKSSAKLKALYQQGYNETLGSLGNFSHWLNTI